MAKHASRPPDGTAPAYTSNPLGNRIRKDARSTSTEYFFFGGGAIAELNPATGAWTGYIGYGKRIAKDTSNNGTGAHHYHGDHLGSARITKGAVAPNAAAAAAKLTVKLRVIQAGGSGSAEEGIDAETILVVYVSCCVGTRWMRHFFVAFPEARSAPW